MAYYQNPPLAGNLVILPNTKLSDAVVTDFEKPDLSMIFGVDGGVSYSSDLERVEKVIMEVATEVMKNNPEGVKDFTRRLNLKFRRFQYQFFYGDEGAKQGRDFRFETLFYQSAA